MDTKFLLRRSGSNLDFAVNNILNRLNSLLRSLTARRNLTEVLCINIAGNGKIAGILFIPKVFFYSVIGCFNARVAQCIKYGLLSVEYKTPRGIER